MGPMLVTNNNCSPRDLGLLRWQAGCRVPLEIVSLGEVIECARQHCRMRPERLAELQEDYPDEWSYAVSLIQWNRQKRTAGVPLTRKPRFTRADPQLFVESVLRRKGIVGLMELI